jgi:hypothetical protein
VGVSFAATVGAVLVSVPGLVSVPALVSASALAGQQAPTPPPQSSQSTPAVADIDKLPISIDRIREQLEREPTLSIDFLAAAGVPVFRTETRSDLVLRFDGEYWRLDKDNNVDPNARPSVNRWHYDFVKMTNPDLPTGYGPGGGINILPGIQAAFSALKNMRDEHERERVRQQIQDELREIEDARRRAGLPPTPPP